MADIGEIIFTAVVGLLVLGVIGGAIHSYFTTPDAIILADKNCPKLIDPDDVLDRTFKVQNHGEAPAEVQFCLSSDFFMFGASETSNWSHSLCFNPSRAAEKQTGIYHTHKAFIKADKNLVDDTENATMTVQYKCTQKIWRVIPRDCEDYTYTCSYEKSDRNGRYEFKG